MRKIMFSLKLIVVRRMKKLFTPYKWMAMKIRPTNISKAKQENVNPLTFSSCVFFLSLCLRCCHLMLLFRVLTLLFSIVCFFLLILFTRRLLLFTLLSRDSYRLFAQIISNILIASRLHDWLIYFLMFFGSLSSKCRWHEYHLFVRL